MNSFIEYVSNYDLNEPHISYKYYHSYRVSDIMESLAKDMNLPLDDINLAKTIGLLHDIGRFEQYQETKCFDDTLFDHGEYAVKVIKEHNLLISFNIKENDYEVVLKAIQNHNKFAIDKNLNPRESLFAKMIRDADKLDIIYSLGNDNLKEIIREDDSAISSHVKESFFNEKQIKKTSKDTINDNLVTIFGFIYDINFNISLAIIKKNDYYNKIYNRLKNKELFKPYIDKVNQYIAERTDNNVR